MNHQLIVQCTDRGAHKPRVLARLSVGSKDGRIVMGRQGRTNRHTPDGRFVVPPSTAGANDARSRDDGGVTFTFICPACRRNLPLRDDRLANLTEIGTDGQPWWSVEVLDISHLVT